MEGVFSFIVIPLLIFVSRICDVSLGTLRIIFISKGRKDLAPFVAFFEVLIWAIAIRQLMSNMSNIWLYLAYSLGFAAGTYVGMIIEEKISIGKVVVRVISHEKPNKLIKELRAKNYILTISDAVGREGKVKIIFSVIDRKKLKDFVKVIKTNSPKAFYTIEDIKFARENVGTVETTIKPVNLYIKGK